MAQQQRNSSRRNGKAWSKHSGKGAVGGHSGHRETGRTKPSGNTVGGHALRKLYGADGHSWEYVKISRDPQRRKARREARKSQCVSPATAVSLNLIK